MQRAARNPTASPSRRASRSLDQHNKRASPDCVRRTYAVQSVAEFLTTLLNSASDLGVIKKARNMNLDSVAFADTAPDEIADAPAGARATPRADHTQRIAELFREEYPKLVHYMVARTGSWSEARDVAAQAFAQVLEMKTPDAINFLKAYVYRA